MTRQLNDSFAQPTMNGEVLSTFFIRVCKQLLNYSPLQT